MLSPAITGKLPATVDEMAIVLARVDESRDLRSARLRLRYLRSAPPQRKRLHDWTSEMPKAHCDNAKLTMVGADRSGRRRIGYAVSLMSGRDQCDLRIVGK
jgi:hypothetical protein